MLLQANIDKIKHNNHGISWYRWQNLISVLPVCETSHTPSGNYFNGNETPHIPSGNYFNGDESRFRRKHWNLWQVKLFVCKSALLWELYYSQIEWNLVIQHCRMITGANAYMWKELKRNEFGFDLKVNWCYVKTIIYFLS